MWLKNERHSWTRRSTLGTKALRPSDRPWPSRSRAKQAKPFWERKIDVAWKVQLMSFP